MNCWNCSQIQPHISVNSIIIKRFSKPNNKFKSHFVPFFPVNCFECVSVFNMVLQILIFFLIDFYAYVLSVQCLIDLFTFIAQITAHLFTKKKKKKKKKKF
eukprot:318801_1